MLIPCIEEFLYWLARHPLLFRCHGVIPPISLRKMSCSTCCNMESGSKSVGRNSSDKYTKGKPTNVSSLTWCQGPHIALELLQYSKMMMGQLVTRESGLKSLTSQLKTVRHLISLIIGTNSRLQLLMSRLKVKRKRFKRTALYLKSRAQWQAYMATVLENTCGS